jgi:NO-binding membrane sensor protein with MHYT domain
MWAHGSLWSSWTEGQQEEDDITGKITVQNPDLDVVNTDSSLRYLLVVSSVTMGAVAVWCMHFIGYRGLVMGNGAKEIQIAFNSGLTALSFFIPILVLLAAFLAIGSNEKVRQKRVIFGGTIAGIGISGMNYLGQMAIANYDCVYSIRYVVGSIIIAITASIVALWIFFVLRAGWTNTWWKRALCAFILSGAVSGMHWLAAAGTSYRFKSVKATKDAPLSRNEVLTIVIILVRRSRHSNPRRSLLILYE